MIIDYQPRGVCSRRMTLEVEEGVIRSIRIQGGCDGNLQGISRLVEGMEVSEAIRRLDGIRCGGKPTSCPDQLAQALKQYKAGTGDYSDLMVIPDLELSVEEYGIGFRQGSDLTAAVNQAMQELIDDGTLNELAVKYELADLLLANQ